MPQTEHVAIIPAHCVALWDVTPALANTASCSNSLIPNNDACLGEESASGLDEPGGSNAHQQGEHTAAAAAALEAQLQAAEQQGQELQSQLHHQEVRVANAEAAQRSAESERDAMAQEQARLEDLAARHQQVTVPV